MLLEICNFQPVPGIHAFLKIHAILFFLFYKDYVYSLFNNQTISLYYNTKYISFKMFTKFFLPSRSKIIDSVIHTVSFTHPSNFLYDDAP